MRCAARSDHGMTRPLRGGRADRHLHRLIRIPALSLAFILFAADGAVGPPSVRAEADVAPLPLDPNFKLGVSYYGAFGFDWDARVSKDFAKIADAGYGLIRIWATWCPGDVCTSGSLVDSAGTVKQKQGERFKQMLAFAKARKVYLDITFEPAQFSKQVAGHPPYVNYKAAIKNVADIVVGQQARKWVIFDVCNECMGTDPTKGKDPSKTSIDDTELTKLSYDWQTAVAKPVDPSTYPAVLQDLIGAARKKGINAFFSVVAMGSNQDSPSVADDDEHGSKAAQFYARVYNDAGWAAPLPLVAPHFSRKPCYSEWAERTTRRANYVANQLANKFKVYLQEENRRHDTQGCCGQPGTWSQMPAANPCSDQCNKASDVPKEAFYTGASRAKNKTGLNVWGWVFHTAAGFGCAGSKPFYDLLDDAEEKPTFNNLQFEVDKPH